MAQGGMKGLARPRAPAQALIVLSLLLFGARAAPALELAIGWGYGADVSQEVFNGVYSGNSSGFTSPAAVSTGGFLDLTYARLRIAYQIESGGTQPVISTPIAGYFSVYLTRIVFAAALKYPVTIGPVKVFALLGIEYWLPLFYSDDKANDLLASLSAADQAALHELWLQWGVGADFFTAERFFFRVELLFGVKDFGGVSDRTLVASHSTGSIFLTPGALSLHAELTFGCRLW